MRKEEHQLAFKIDIKKNSKYIKSLTNQLNKYIIIVVNKYIKILKNCHVFQYDTYDI